MNNEIIHSIVDSFDSADVFLQKKHMIKTESVHNPKWPDVYVYTDGSSKGSTKSKDKRSFSGWGVYIRSVSSNGEIREFVNSGNLFNADSREAELRAIHAALSNIKIPGRIKIISDCYYVIKGLCELDLMMERKAAMEKIPQGARQTWYWHEFRLLNVWAEVNELLKNRKILSLETEWVKSHSLDNEEDLPDPSIAKNDKERQLILNCIGNFHADKFANLGARKAVRGALWFLKSEQNEYKLQRSIETCIKNFSVSAFAREEAVAFLSDQPRDYLPRNTLLTIFNQRTIAKIDLAHDQKDAEIALLAQQKREATKAEQILPIPQSLILPKNEDAIEKFRRRFGKHTSIEVAPG
ncbi:ribonuclease H [compost metagenome]